MKRTKTKTYGSLVVILVIGFFCLFTFQDEPQLRHVYEKHENKPEENSRSVDFYSFDPVELQEEDLAVYNKWKEELTSNGNNFTTLQSPAVGEAERLARYYSPESGDYSYANGDLTGNWQQKSFMTNNGFRVDNSLYDQVNDEFYAVSYAGHLYKLEELEENIWSLRNHKSGFKGKDLNGVNLPNGDFRIVQQQGNGGMEYSDDEGRTWTTSNGALFENSWNYRTFVTSISDGKKITAFGSNYHGSSGYYHIYMSTDYGLNYTEASLNWPHSDYEVFMLKMHNSQRIYAFAWSKNTGQVDIYVMDQENQDFSFVRTTQSFSDFNRVFGTYSGGNYHFYLTATAANIFYSSNEGASWTQTNNSNDNQIEGIHPDMPNVVFKGFVQIRMSTDYGATWSNNSHYMSDYYVWDLRHMRSWEKSDGTNVLFAGLDFGCYYSEDPSDWDSWVAINTGNPTPMVYDAISSDINNVGYIATQDRGIRGYLDEGGPDGEYSSPEVASTDVLRVTLANNEQSVWYWFYYGTIGRSDVTFNGDDANKASSDFYSNWWAHNMVASPNPNEDAVYIPAGNQIDIISYNGSSVERIYHPYVFPETMHSFGYSKINTNRWYVGLKSGVLMYSNDGGQAFTTSSYSGTWPGQDDSYKKRRPVITTSPIDEATVYYAGKGNVFLISTDGGQTFTNHTNGLNITRFTDFDITPDGKYIFASCDLAGAWVFSVDDDQWYQMTGADVPEVEFTDAQYLPTKNLVRFATYGSGIIDFKLNQDLSGGVEPTYYYVVCKKNGFKLRPETTAEGSEMIFTESSDTDDWVQWERVESDGGYFYLQNKHTGLYFRPVTDYDFSRMEQRLTTSDDNRTQWTLIATSDQDGYYHIYNRASNKKMRIIGTSLNNPYIEQADNGSTGDWTRWEIVPIGSSARMVKNEITEVELTGNDLIVYPNPTTGIIKVSNLPNEIGGTIYSVSGRKALRVESVKTIDMRELDRGNYLLKMDDGTTLKILKVD